MGFFNQQVWNTFPSRRVSFTTNTWSNAWQCRTGDTCCPLLKIFWFWTSTVLSCKYIYRHIGWVWYIWCLTRVYMLVRLLHLAQGAKLFLGQVKGGSGDLGTRVTHSSCMAAGQVRGRSPPAFSPCTVVGLLSWSPHTIGGDPPSITQFIFFISIYHCPHKNISQKKYQTPIRTLVKKHPQNTFRCYTTKEKNPTEQNSPWKWLPKQARFGTIEEIELQGLDIWGKIQLIIGLLPKLSHTYMGKW